MHLLPSLRRPIHFRWKTLVVIAGTLLTIGVNQANSATINARSPALVDVTTAVALARDGDTVIVPAGTVNWNATLNITKGIELRGATTISGAGTKSVTANDLTVIKQDVSPLIKISASPPQTTKVSGLTFQANTNTGNQLVASGGGSSGPGMVRVDHCHFVGFTGRGIWLDGWVFGVADHNYMQSIANGQCLLINHATYGGKLLGHGSWADYPWFGTDKFFFIEDNTLTGEGKATTNGGIDSENGGRWVVRHNYFINCRPGWHGTEGANRGCRAVEVYNNTFDWSIAPSAMNRSGTALYHDNNWIGAKSTQASHSQVAVFREYAGVSASCPFGFADGSGPFDMNATEPDGTFVEGHPPRVFASGTVTSSSSITITDSSKNWAPNQWAGYSVKQTNRSAASYPKGAYITGNTNNTITFNYWGSDNRGPSLSFRAGDTYEIRKVLRALDQVGAGKSDLLSGGGGLSPVINTKTGAATYAHIALEPAFSWNNTHSDGTAYGFSSNFPTEKLGRDLYNLGKGFPANSTPSQVSTIYTAALNGVVYTRPFAYPHPLVNGGTLTSPTPTPSPSATPVPTATPAGTPNPPTDLRIVP